ncbi:hypothetical protein GCM10010349_75220 [Streptomyces flavofungini]|nr:hypothetical protein GCM10010349_75220 [Streptomyces flavofungini]
MLGDEIAYPGGALGVHVVPHENEWRTELLVGCDEQVAEAGPGETAALFGFVVLVKHGPVAQPGRFAGPIAAQGQVSFTHPVIASSSRSSARRAGTW